jgi:hypothetical protein
MQTEPTVPTAIIIPFPKRHRFARSGAAAKLATTGTLLKPASVQPQPSVRTPQPSIGPVTGLSSSRPSVAPASRQPSVAAPRQEAAPLSGVMAELDHALTQQGAAVARWRKAINDLRVAMDGLEGSLKQYRDSLTPVSNNGTSR